MVQAQDIATAQLERFFSLKLSTSLADFPEWQTNLPVLTDTEKVELDRIRSNFLSQLQRSSNSVLEEAVKLIVVGHLLELAGFYQYPFELSVEQSVTVTASDGKVLINGRLDILVIHRGLWVVLVESKNSAIDVSQGISQALAYMISSPDRPVFGLVTNGKNYIFLKLLNGEDLRYAWSEEFSLLSPLHNRLYEVLSILKRIGQVITHLPSKVEAA